METKSRNQFSTLDIGRALGLERERLREWMVRGFLKPTVSAEGQGTKAVFSRTDAYGVALFLRLLEIGFRREQAGEFVREFMAREKNESKRTQYLIFRSTKNGTLLINLAPGEYKINLETGFPEWPVGGSEKAKEAMSRLVQRVRPGWTDEWEEIHTINLNSLYMRVDAALEQR